MNRLIVLLLLGALMTTLAACGKRGRLEAPEGSEFPQEYPRR
jgi:predicted small lipoprotein YifL